MVLPFQVLIDSPSSIPRCKAFCRRRSDERSLTAVGWIHAHSGRVGGADGIFVAHSANYGCYPFNNSDPSKTAACFFFGPARLFAVRLASPVAASFFLEAVPPPGVAAA
jgi:hypothetical protein